MDETKRRKPEAERKTVYLRVRVTQDQEILLKDAARRAGIVLSAWAVERLVRAAREELKDEKS